MCVIMERGGKTIRNSHCVTVTSYLTNTDILMISAIRHATCAIPPECCSGLWLLRWGHPMMLGWLMKFPQSLMSESPLLTTLVRTGDELVVKHLLIYQGSQQKPQKQRKAAVCNTIGCPSVSCSAVDGCSDPRPVHLKPSHKPD